jgi:hypothetical protein
VVALRRTLSAVTVRGTLGARRTTAICRTSGAVTISGTLRTSRTIPIRGTSGAIAISGTLGTSGAITVGGALGARRTVTVRGALRAITVGRTLRTSGTIAIRWTLTARLVGRLFARSPVRTPVGRRGASAVGIAASERFAIACSRTGCSGSPVVCGPTLFWRFALAAVSAVACGLAARLAVARGRVRRALGRGLVEGRHSSFQLLSYVHGALLRCGAYVPHCAHNEHYWTSTTDPRRFPEGNIR